MMGKRRDWFSNTLKNIFTCSFKDKTEKKSRKSGTCLGRRRRTPSTCSGAVNAVVPASNPRTVEVNSVAVEDEHNRHDHPIALATAAEDEHNRHDYPLAPLTVDAAAEVAQQMSVARSLGKMDEKVAAIKIQTAFRGYLARRMLSTMKGLARLKSFIERQHSKGQPNTALEYMQMRAHLQSAVCATRTRTLERNLALQRLLQKKHEKKLEEPKASPNEPWWGWSWSELRMAAQPQTNDKKVNIGHVFRKSSASLSMSTQGDMKMQTPKAQKQIQPFSTPNSGRLRKLSPKCSTNPKTDDLKSIASIQSDRYRKHSLTGSCTGDDLSLTSCPASSRHYMASTVSSRAKMRMPSPLGKTHMTATTGGSARKRLSFSAVPAGITGNPGPSGY